MDAVLLATEQTRGQQVRRNKEGEDKRKQFACYEFKNNAKCEKERLPLLP